MLVWALQPLARSVHVRVAVGGTAVGGDVVGRAQRLTRPICLVQRLSLLQAGHARSFSPLSHVPGLAVMSFRLYLRSTYAEVTQELFVRVCVT